MKVVVKKKVDIQELAITTEFIKLQDALKYANLVMSGGDFGYGFSLGFHSPEESLTH